MGLEVLHKRLILAQALLLKEKRTPLEAISSRLQILQDGQTYQLHNLVLHLLSDI